MWKTQLLVNWFLQKHNELATFFSTQTFFYLIFHVLLGAEKCFFGKVCIYKF